MGSIIDQSSLEDSDDVSGKIDEGRREIIVKELSEE